MALLLRLPSAFQIQSFAIGRVGVDEIGKIKVGGGERIA
jgi:hypothetical protein